ncbi:MAG: glycosyltransferase family 4 protein [Chloroflexi bacterium]|nr:glycosyltransferase family 4 protein [Chloroflexota bacterium]MCL5273466.1 glycosyltransferase family 4 protein [Chloroflexota bacterium]
MRVAFIAGEYPPLQGGLGDYTRELARALSAGCHEVHVLTKLSPGLPHHEVTAGISIHRLAYRWNWLSLAHVNRFIDAHRPDVLNLQYQTAAYNMHAAIHLLPRLLRRRVPVAVTFHDLRAPYLFPKAGWLRGRAVLELANSASAAIVTNIEDRQSLLQAGVSNVTMIPIGSNITPQSLDGFNRAAWLRTQRIPVGEFVVGYFGFLNASKGGDDLIRAVAILREQSLDVRLLLIGGTSGESDPTNVAYSREVMQLAEQAGVREHIAVTGYLNDRGVTEALTACDCIALPYRDGVSFRRGTLMAALAHGCAIVTTHPRVQLPEIVDGANMLLAPPADPQALAGAIARVLQDIELRRRLQAGSTALSRLFTWDHIAAETLEVYRHLCA